MTSDRDTGGLGWIKAVLVGVALVALAGAAGWLLWSAPSPPPAGPATAPPASTPPPALPAPVAASTGDYTANLSTGVQPPEFSGGTVTRTRKGDRPMLGRYDRSGVTFTLDALPPHEAVHLVMDLALLNSWNGSSAYWGPDVWSCDEAGGGRHLFAATFCNCGFFSNNNEQTFPDQYPAPDGAAPYPAWTGAAEKEDLGEMHHFSNSSPEDGDCSSVYHLDWTFPHRQPVLALDFKGRFKDKHMRFAFLGFHAQTVAHLTQLTDTDAAAAWVDLSDDDPVKANAAVWRLASAGGTVLPYVHRRMTEPPAGGASPYLPGRIGHLLQVLGETSPSPGPPEPLPAP
jgi:hypothetical protein